MRGRTFLTVCVCVCVSGRAAPGGWCILINALRGMTTGCALMRNAEFMAHPCYRNEVVIWIRMHPPLIPLLPPVPQLSL